MRATGIAFAGANPTSLEKDLSDPGHGMRAPVFGLTTSLHCGLASSLASNFATEHAESKKTRLSKEQILVEIVFIKLF